MIASKAATVEDFLADLDLVDKLLKDTAHLDEMAC